MKSSLPRRRLIPRWRPTRKTLETTEVTSTLSQLSQPLRFDRTQFEEAVTAWRTEPTIGHLGDVVSFAGDVDIRPQIVTVVKEAKGKGLGVSPVQEALFREVDEDEVSQEAYTIEGREDFRRRVAHLRKSLVVAPENLLALLDLAQLQLAAGKVSAAQRLITTALGIAPNGRLVLRTAARFYVHLGDVERAHQIIRRHPGTKEDPWLIASEIALADAAGVASAMASVGRRLIKEAKAQPRNLAELAGALATSEMHAGNVKEARQLLRKALRNPTDNIVAQAVIDASDMGIRLDDPISASAVKHSAEAQLLQAWQDRNEGEAEQHALQWHAEEPFSSRPIQFLTALYSLQSKYGKALDWVRKGLIADPADEGLIANLAFSTAALGDTEQAEVAIRRIRDSRLAPYLRATEGLIALKRKDFAQAETLYREAVTFFEKSSRPELAALALAHYAKFALESEAPDSARIRAEAESKFRRASSVDAYLILSKLLPVTPALPLNDEEKRRLTQWVFDAKTNTLVERPGVTSRGAAAIVFPGRKGPPSKRS